jgi:hypothetical protein
MADAAAACRNSRRERTGRLLARNNVADNIPGAPCSLFLMDAALPEDGRTAVIGMMRVKRRQLSIAFLRLNL